MKRAGPKSVLMYIGRRGYHTGIAKSQQVQVAGIIFPSVNDWNCIEG